VQFGEANFDDVVETCDDVTTVRPHCTFFIAKIIELGNESRWSEDDNCLYFYTKPTFGPSPSIMASYQSISWPSVVNPRKNRIQMNQISFIIFPEYELPLRVDPGHGDIRGVITTAFISFVHI
jgi:hypothetical protein